MLAKGCLTHEEKVKVDGAIWYLPFFVTKQEESFVALQMYCKPGPTSSAI